VQIVDIVIDCRRILLSCHPINAGRRLLFELLEGPGQQVRRYVVHQRREPFTLAPLRSLSYASQRL
jgi:hypothetical protein